MPNKEDIFAARQSIFNHTPLYDYLCIDNVDDNSMFDNAAKVFRAETTEALRLFDANDLNYSLIYRSESVRGYIVKVLLYIGLLPKNNHFPTLARLMEIIATRPELSLDAVITDFAETHNANKTTISRIIDKNFNVYDPVFIERVNKITDSQPQTAKDVLCDLAVHVRLKSNSDTLHE